MRRRQWSLASNGFLRYSYLGAFDRAMLALVRRYGVLSSGFAYNLNMDTDNQTVVVLSWRSGFYLQLAPQSQHSGLYLAGLASGRTVLFSLRMRSVSAGMAGWICILRRLPIPNGMGTDSCVID